MSNNDEYKCPKCGSNKFNLVYRTYEEFEEEFQGEFLAVVCVDCDGCFWAFAIDQKVFKHAERAWIKEELGEPLTVPEDIE